MLNYFNWSEITTVSNDVYYFLNILNWEDISFIYLNDVFFFIRVVINYFFNFFWSTNSLSHFSIVAGFFLSSNEQLYLNYAFFNDMLISVLTFDTLLHFFTESSVLDLVINSPEVLFFFNQFGIVFSHFTLPVVSLVYDSFFFNTAVGFFSDFVVFFSWLFFIVSFFCIFFGVTAPTSIGGVAGFNFFITKFWVFINQFSFENRLQLDWSLVFLFFAVLLWVPLLMTYDDVNVEVIELLHSFICLFFVFIIFFLLIKYSVHYFSFLENTVSDGYSTAFILKQFVRDISNTFALFLRFFLLLFRLNIYDGLDDFLDSYYIFFIDFDEDSYLDELFYTFDFISFFSDNREDIIFYRTVEFDWWGDLFSKFFIIFGKFFFFWALILEEIFRVSLALYISYLIIFEVHAVNLSYNEEINKPKIN